MTTNGERINGMDKIENVLTDHNLANHETLGLRKITFDTSANKPSSGDTTELFVETDTNKLYRGTGTGWQSISGSGGGASLPDTIANVLTDHNLANHETLGLRKITFDTAVNKPGSGTTTELFVETDTNDIYRGTGSGWQLISGGGISLPNTIANVLTNHNKTNHDSLGIDADTVDTKHFTDIQADSQSKVDTHASLTSTHGVSGDIVGTTDTQTLTNKTLSTGSSVLGADDLPNTIANILSDHNLANHETLGIRKITFDTSANKPSSGTTTELFVETDTNKIYRGTGTGWQEIGGSGGVSLPNTIANVLTDHNKANHDSLLIDADTLDTYHYSDIDKSDLIGNYVITGLVPATSANLTSDISEGYAFVEGLLIHKVAESHTYTASKDTYIFLDNTGTYTFTEVANGASAPSIPANSVTVAKVVTDASAITSVTTASNNTFIGYNTGISNITGYSNVFIGINAGQANTTGYNNTFVGDSAGYSNTTGYKSVFIGYQAGYSNTIGVNNIFIGYQAGYTSSYKSGMTCIGYRAGYNLSSGASNTFLGNSAGYFTTSGSYNTFIGYSAGYKNTTGSYNTYIGKNAGYYTSSGGNNQTTTNSVMIGYDTRANASGDTNEIVIGDTAVGKGSNTVVLGNDSITDTYLKGTVSIGYDSGDYGGGFSTYTPPTGREGAMRIVADTNAGTPGQRIYVYIAGAWHYVALT